MDKQIKLTEEEIMVIEKHLNGEMNPFFGDDHENAVIDKIINDAAELMAELDAYDELDDNLVQWYYDKYKNQTANYK